MSAFVASLPQSILAYTGPLFAMIHARDADHQPAVRFAQSFAGHLLIADLEAKDLECMRRLTIKYDTMDLADASLVAIGERLGLPDVITPDRPDLS